MVLHRLLAFVFITALCIFLPVKGFVSPIVSSQATTRVSSVQKLFATTKSNSEKSSDDAPSCSSIISSASSINRRLAIQQGGGIALSSLLLLNNNEPAYADASGQDYDDSKKKRILITGSNSGIGFDAAQRMAVRGHEIVLACVSFLKCCSCSFLLYMCVCCILSMFEILTSTMHYMHT